MRPQLRHIFYLLGLLAILGSYLFWGRMSFTFFVLLMTGFIIWVISFLIIIYKDSLNIIIFWLLITIIFFVLKPSLKEWLIGKSLNIPISKNEKLFERVNNILISKKGPISFSTAYGKDGDSIFSPEEIATLRLLLDKTKILSIDKNETFVYYRMYGAMDVDGGIFYFYTGYEPKSHFGHIKGKWYYD